MASTTFKYRQTVISSDWLNDVNAWVYGRGWTTPMRFGAQGNGFHDDTQAIYNALTSGQNVYFPPGVYPCQQLTLPNLNNICVQGTPGVFKSQILATQSTGFNWSLQGCNNFQISDMGFTPGQGVTSTGGIQIDDHSSLRLYDSIIYNHMSQGLLMNGTVGSQISGCIMERNLFFSNGIDGVSPQFQALYSQDYMYANNQFGSLGPFTPDNRPAIAVHFSTCSNGYFGDNLLWENLQGMVMDTACQENRMIGNRFEQSQQAGLWMINCQQNLLLGNWINNNSLAGNGLYHNAIIDSSTHNIFTGNQSYDWQGPGHFPLSNWRFQNGSTDNTFSANKSAFGTTLVSVDGTSFQNEWDQTVAFSSGNTQVAAAQTFYIGPGGLSANPIAGKLQQGIAEIVSMRIVISTPSAGGDGQTYTLYKNGAPTSMTGSLTGGGTSLNIVGAVPLADGDNFSVRVSATGAAVSTYVMASLGIAGC